MPEPQPIPFVPKWLRDASDDELDALSGSVYGTVPPDFPRLVTRIVPKSHGCTLSARSLAETLQLQQSLTQYAARDVVSGPNPDFADLRSLKDSVLEFAKLTIEPFEEGSFVIPARLEADPFKPEDKADTQIETERILERLAEIMGSLHSPEKATSISMGTLQTLESFGRLLNREAEYVEIAPYNADRKQLPLAEVRPATLTRVKTLLDRRKPTEQTLETVEGCLTALDTVTNAFQLTVAG